MFSQSFDLSLLSTQRASSVQVRDVRSFQELDHVVLAKSVKGKQINT